MGSGSSSQKPKEGQIISQQQQKVQNKDVSKQQNANVNNSPNKKVDKDKDKKNVQNNMIKKSYKAQGNPQNKDKSKERNSSIQIKSYSKKSLENKNSSIELKNNETTHGLKKYSTQKRIPLDSTKNLTIAQQIDKRNTKTKKKKAIEDKRLSQLIKIYGLD